MPRQPQAVVEPLGQHARTSRQRGQRGDPSTEARGVQYRADLYAGLGVLVGHEIEQRPRAEEHRSGADRARLGLQGDLRPPEAVGARQRPARQGHDAVGGTRRQDERVETYRLRSLAVEQVQRAVIDVPGERFRSILDVWAQHLEVPVQRLRLCRLEAVELGGFAAEILWLAAIDLPAVLPSFIDD